LVVVSKLEVKTGARGIPYKFVMLKIPKIETLWEPFHYFHLEYQNSMKSTDLKRGNPRLTQLSRLEKEMESMKEEFQKELDALKYDIHSMREEILNEIRVRHTHKSFTQEEVNENKYVESLSLIEKVEAQLKIKKFESLTYDLSTDQDPHFHGFDSTPTNYFIPNIGRIKFDGNYPVTWIFQMEPFFETMMKKLRNQAIMEYLIKWKNLPAEDSTWEDDNFIQKHPELLKR
jgi:hypothetical protein